MSTFAGCVSIRSVEAGSVAPGQRSAICYSISGFGVHESPGCLPPAPRGHPFRGRIVAGPHPTVTKKVQESSSSTLRRNQIGLDIGSFVHLVIPHVHLLQQHGPGRHPCRWQMLGAIAPMQLRTSDKPSIEPREGRCFQQGQCCGQGGIVIADPVFSEALNGRTTQLYPYICPPWRCRQQGLAVEG